eukprot:TRINITY_DN94_c0_g1_i1.p2 TRINITY_DN94_c0_g1~~TRINITY_DN94_c0_g1_i1.p2  ORF type:complete len:502 (+),score=275.24 TRINITY_DN94_c0_g1_i1:39-1508(+)
MKFSQTLLLLAVLLLGAFFCCATASYEEEDNVLVLNSDNFDQAVQEFPSILVEFYAPWCGHCKTLAPEYATAASLLREQGSEVRLAKVDATISNDLAQRFQVQGFPTLKYFRNGKPSEYTGGRTSDTIVSWIEKKNGPAATTVTSADQIAEIKEKNDVSVFGYFTKDSENLAAFLSAASDSETIVYTLVADRALLPEASADSDSDLIVLYKNFDEENNVYPGVDDDFSLKSIQDFVSLYSIPLVNEFLPSTRVFSSPIRTHFFLFVNPEDKEAAKTALVAPATKYRGEALFTVIDIAEPSTKRISEYFGIDSSSAPQAFIFILAETPLQYKHDSKAIDSTEYAAFLQGVLDKEISPFFKTEEPEEYSGKGVRVLVGKDHDEIINDATKNVLVEYYAPWCGHCKTLAPIYDLIAESFDESDNVVIAKIDSTKNEVDGVHIEGFPTLILYPAGADAEPVKYDGAREYDDIRAFVELHGVNVDVKKVNDDEL